MHLLLCALLRMGILQYLLQAFYNHCIKLAGYATFRLCLYFSILVFSKFFRTIFKDTKIFLFLIYTY